MAAIVDALNKTSNSIYSPPFSAVLRIAFTPTLTEFSAIFFFILKGKSDSIFWFNGGVLSPSAIPIRMAPPRLFAKQTQSFESSYQFAVLPITVSNLFFSMYWFSFILFQIFYKHQHTILNLFLHILLYVTASQYIFPFTLLYVLNF